MPVPAPHSLPALQRLIHERKTREDDELQLLNKWIYRSCKVVGVAVVGVPLHCPNVPLALPGDLPVTLIWCIQVDNVEETAAVKHTDTKGLHLTGLISKHQAHMELTALCLEAQEPKEVKHFTRQVKTLFLKMLHLTTYFKIDLKKTHHPPTKTRHSESKQDLQM